MKQYVTVGLGVLVGAALFETALIPGLLIGGVAVLAPRYLPKGTLPKLRRRVETLAEKTFNRKPAAGDDTQPEKSVSGGIQNVLPKFAIGQAVAKTITFRIIVTGLDFTTNYLVIGEIGTAAGLSTFNLIAGPLFYLGHEAVWNYAGSSDEPVDLAKLMTRGKQDGAEGVPSRLTISRALAKTITFRVFASTMDFATNYIVVRDLGQALILSSSGLILGPFVYYGHEKAWDYFSKPKARADLPAVPLLPAPTPALPLPI
jgi:uncharacterized membrane protein